MNNVFRLTDHEHADLIQLFERALFIEIDVEAGNALELVERAAGDAESASGNHRHPGFVAGEQRRQHQRNFVAYAAGGMFVDLRRRILRILQHAAALHHRLGQVLRLGRRHSAEINRHRPGANLVIRNFAESEICDQRFDFISGQFLTVTLLLDQCGDVHEFEK